MNEPRAWNAETGQPLAVKLIRRSSAPRTRVPRQPRRSSDLTPTAIKVAKALAPRNARKQTGILLGFVIADAVLSALRRR